MALNENQKNAVLDAARFLIGVPYHDIDCSHFVHRAYSVAGLEYTYQNTTTFSTLVGSYFEEIDNISKLEAGDVLMFSHHMGIWDPTGCRVIQRAFKFSKMRNDECVKYKNDLPFLSSRSGGNRGPDFGKLHWFGDLKKIYRWKLVSD